MAFAFFAFASLANAQVATTPNLLVNLVPDSVASSINANTSNVILANVRLDATTSSEDIRLASLPITLTTGNGARASDLTCRVVNAASPTVALNTGNNASTTMVSGLNRINLDNPVVIARGTTTNLLVRCDIGSGLVVDGTYQFSINSNNVVATGNTTGTPAVVGVTRASTPVVVPPVVPGIPNTGFGGNASTNVALILGSIVVAGLGLAYTRKLAR